jgi:hypothetical protein
MSLFLDLFILLDTIRIVLCGGVNTSQARTPERAKAMQDFQLSTNTPAEDPAAPQVPDFEWTSV